MIGIFHRIPQVPDDISLLIQKLTGFFMKLEWLDI